MQTGKILATMPKALHFLIAVTIIACQCQWKAVTRELWKKDVMISSSLVSSSSKMMQVTAPSGVEKDASQAYPLRQHYTIQSNQTSSNDYYASFWNSAYKIAFENNEKLLLSNNEGKRITQQPCPKVFVYDLPDSFRDVSHQDVMSQEYSFGDAVNQFNGTLRGTGQYNFGVLLEHRLRQPSSCYYTNDPTKADLFFVPVLTKPKTMKHWMEACWKLGDVDDLPKLLPYLNETTACQHFFVFSKGHYAARPCKGWFWDPLPIFNNSLRLAYSHIPGEGGKRPSFLRRASGPAAKERKHPNLFSVPYPSSLHQHGQAKNVDEDTSIILKRQLLSEVHREDESHKQRTTVRKHLMSFIGAYDHGDMAVRKAIKKAQKRYNNTDIFPFTKPSQGLEPLGLLVKQESIFCLEPAGDSPWRKSLADSISMGCIPVLFSEDSDDVAPWFWGEWKNQARLLINRDDFVAGKIDLYELLSQIPGDLLVLMQDTLSQYGRNFQYSLSDDIGDGVDIAVRRLTEEATKLKNDGLCSVS